MNCLHVNRLKDSSLWKRAWIFERSTSLKTAVKLLPESTTAVAVAYFGFFGSFRGSTSFCVVGATGICQACGLIWE